MKKLIMMAAGAFVLLVVFDAIFKEPQRLLKIENQPRSNAQLNAELHVTGLKYDLSTHSVTGTFKLDVKAKDARDINGVALSPSDRGYREWLAAVVRKGQVQDPAQQGPDCQLQLSEELEASAAQPVSSATLECKNISIAGGSGSAEVWYPFDSYRAVLSPEACINSSDGACGKSSKAEPTSINSFDVVIADPNFTADLSRDRANPGRYILVLKRRFFVRMVSVTFLMIAVIFLLYLASSGDPKDLLPKSLGFFGALWGLRALIVPSSVTIFPTLVDFSILTIFGVLFMLVLSKLYEGDRV